MIDLAAGRAASAGHFALDLQMSVDAAASQIRMPRAIVYCTCKTHLGEAWGLWSQNRANQVNLPEAAFAGDRGKGKGVVRGKPCDALAGSTGSTSSTGNTKWWKSGKMLWTGL
jgi:hypothetical protein